MEDVPALHDPRMVAVWPGMGNVALNAGIYLLAKLNMTLFAEFAAGDLFDVEHVDVKNGTLDLGRRPRHRFFVWKDPAQQHDLVVFVGEAQPPAGKVGYCRQLIGFAKQLGVSHLYTFAAMATRMRPEHRSRVLVAATDEATLSELGKCEVGVLEDGQISGLNGILLGVAKEEGLHGVCMLGEMPHVFGQLAYPKASLAILKAFVALTNLEVDFTEMAELAETSEQQLTDILTQLEQAYERQETAEEADEEEEEVPEFAAEEPATEPEHPQIEELFRAAMLDRSKAFELKQELDRLGLFDEYEDRFLDLFKKPA